jgi:hypothetical protein
MKGKKITMLQWSQRRPYLPLTLSKIFLIQCMVAAGYGWYAGNPLLMFLALALSFIITIASLYLYYIQLIR